MEHFGLNFEIFPKTDCKPRHGLWLIQWCTVLQLVMQLVFMEPEVSVSCSHRSYVHWPVS